MEMTMTFNPGDKANAIAKDGQEVTVRIESKVGDVYFIRTYDEDGLFKGGIDRVEAEKLLPLRGPYYAIRGQVLTTSKHHPNEIGEIVAMAESASGKTYYQVEFKDEKAEWFDGDNIFIQHTPRPE